MRPSSSPFIDVVLVANERYAPGLTATRESLVAACSALERLRFHVFGDADMEPLARRLPLSDYNGSKLPYLRLFLPELLPECDWVLYSDVDTLWFRDPIELWEERDDAKAICWVADFPVIRVEYDKWRRSKGVTIGATRHYACSGVALLNLRKWREMDLTARAMRFIRDYGCPPYADQDVLNALLADDARLLDPVWDMLAPGMRLSPCVYHVTGIGRHFGKARYDGPIPQYAWWFAWRGEASDRQAVARRFRRLARLADAVLPLVIFLHNSPPDWYWWKVLLMKVWRRLGYARVTREVTR